MARREEKNPHMVRTDRQSYPKVTEKIYRKRDRRIVRWIGEPLGIGGQLTWNTALVS